MMNKNLVISTPRGAVYTVKTASGKVTARLEWNKDFGQRRTKDFQNAQVKFDLEVLKQMEPYMQLDTGAMIFSARLSTVPGTGEIIVNTPYASRVYHSKSAVGRATGALRGPYYFQRMVADKREYLRRFAANAVGGK